MSGGTANQNEELRDLFCSPKFFGLRNGGEWYEVDKWHLWCRKEIHTGAWRANLRKRGCLADVDVDGKVAV
jgi:hypothetical protein